MGGRGAVHYHGGFFAGGCCFHGATIACICRIHILERFVFDWDWTPSVGFWIPPWDVWTNRNCWVLTLVLLFLGVFLFFLILLSMETVVILF
ncbi:hypothetical protein BDY21DRAFT_359805 [Lineolata rhizophorae]|uniref:Transmembrane protein n=1 Tax=Lineolata rhizophorae TaxID=578093 RepID=A0A6A6NKM9_9PEZI|nr:hypothetical protein BDY21DRAFT_359805 [Lineolata rhizophorae]